VLYVDDNDDDNNSNDAETNLDLDATAFRCNNVPTTQHHEDLQRNEGRELGPAAGDMF
jgi:hypothetical protein